MSHVLRWILPSLSFSMGDAHPGRRSSLKSHSSQFGIGENHDEHPETVLGLSYLLNKRSKTNFSAHTGMGLYECIFAMRWTFYSNATLSKHGFDKRNAQLTWSFVSGRFVQYRYGNRSNRFPTCKVEEIRQNFQQVLFVSSHRNCRRG